MSLDSVTDALFAALIAVPVTLVAVGLVELAILTLVALPIVACLTAALLPDAPFRSPAEHGAQPPVDVAGQPPESVVSSPPFFASRLRWSEARTSSKASAIRKPGGCRGPP